MSGRLTAHSKTKVCTNIIGVVLLYIFSGLPGTGKSTLSQFLAQYLNATYFRIDSIEQTMRNTKIENLYDHGYHIAFQLAKDNLNIGQTVIADSTNPIYASRVAWWQVAQTCHVPHRDIEVICSDLKQHRQRVESRQSDIPHLKLPTWDTVCQREYEVWHSQRIIIDTANKTPEQSKKDLLLALQLT